MKKANWPIWSALGAALLLVSPALAAEPAAKTAGAAKTPAKPAAKIDARAKAALMSMAEALAKADTISVVMRGSYDVTQADGRKVQFSERRAVRLDRPGYLRVETQESGGRKTVTAFDGKAATLLDVKEKVYGQAELKGSTDDALRYLVQTLGVRLPLAMLFTTTLPAELNQRLVALDYVERDDLSGADHLAGRMTDVDFEIWTTADAPALPQRLTITYRTAEGQPQYRAEFSDWSINAASMPKPDLDLPADAERIPFLARSAAETKKSKGAAK